jgi:iron complex transport system substrate-binding protein
MLIARAPDVVLEVSASTPAGPWAPDRERLVWSALPSIPAVRTGRIYFLTGDYLVVPGPRLAQGVEAMAKTLHPDAFK